MSTLYPPWTLQEDAYLLTHEGMSHRAMGAQLHRTQQAVRARVRRLHGAEKSRTQAVEYPLHPLSLDTKRDREGT